MKMSGYILLGILVVGGFGIFGYVVGDNLKRSTADNEIESDYTLEQKPNDEDFARHALDIKS